MLALSISVGDLVVVSGMEGNRNSLDAECQVEYLWLVLRTHRGHKTLLISRNSLIVNYKPTFSGI